MGQRGPAKEPAAYKIAKGTFRKDRDGTLEVPSGLPVMPTWLDAESQKVWDDVLAELSRIDGLTTAVDAYAMSRYCDDWVEYWTAAALIEERGLIIFSKQGGAYQNPAVGVRNKASERLMKFEKCFGMNPSDRTGMKLDKPKQGVRSRKA
jgi:P27 family predicted phage terminase small subunit